MGAGKQEWKLKKNNHSNQLLSKQLNKGALKKTNNLSDIYKIEL